MEVEYSLTPADFLAFARFRRWGRRPRPAVRWPSVVWVVLLLLMFLFVTAKGGLPGLGFLPGVGLGALAALLIFLLFVVLVLRSQKKLLKDARNQWLFATRRMTLSPEELSIVSWFSRLYYRWEVVADIGLAPEHVFLFLTSTDAAIVPRRAFRDEQHFEEFVALARRYREGATPPAGIMDALPAEAPRRPTTITRAPE